ncbi:carboxylesterase family protein-like protein [Myriangium duriaei CBS 260.36]|uniref:Carboxylesterase family protein-like protein n=1 Tax=Myriangium duriaei CBS 260.36 TaxID=1168546 RepID=A0A9P4JCB2_9PEZI|nr:carboxylesterase family protein-like protein [Myriangium duriaei CBS 260.36]
MARLTTSTAILAALIATSSAYAQPTHAGPSGQTSLTFLYNNNLNFTDDANHIGAILLDPLSLTAGQAACTSLGESLLTKQALQSHSADFVSLLSYQAYAGRASAGQLYLIQGGTVRVASSYSAASSSLQFGPAPYGQQSLPVLCTQSSNQNMPSNAVATNSNAVTVSANGNSFVGFRNQKSFRFLGIPYAPEPARFEYSTVNTATGQTYQATAYGQECTQPYAPQSGENCLFLNIQTPYIPKQGSAKNLRPVHFWIHGGGFTGGTGADAGSDGGQISSREDVVVVTINYRLTTLGFLAIPGTNIKGNFGIGDQINALEWTIRNIAAFGGDPNQITINGESAGAGSVRTLLGSPKAIGKYRGAIIMSNLGGGVTLGLNGDYATTYSSYLTINGSYAVAGQQIFTEANCTQSSLAAQIACLKQVPAQTLANLNTVARYVVQDGTIVDTPNLDVANKVHGAAHVNTMWGNVANDGASFCTYPKTPVTSEVQGIMEGLSISQAYAQSIIDSGLFPFYSTGNLTLDAFNVTQRVSTDIQFRCIDQATVYAGVHTGAFKASYYYQMDRSANGYNPENVDGAGPIEPGYPYGDPELPYFKLHGSDMPWVFGNLYPLRDANDLTSVQRSTAYFGSFVRELQPNPETGYLKARNYQSVLQGVQASGPWEPVANANGPMKLLDVVSRTANFQDLQQCKFLNYSISYYLDGGA